MVVNLGKKIACRDHIYNPYKLLGGNGRFLCEFIFFLERGPNLGIQLNHHETFSRGQPFEHQLSPILNKLVEMRHDCLPVRGWATLEDPIRLCAYLTDETEADACESRGYRLGDGLSEAEVEVAGLFLLLCANEYVIAVSRERGLDDTLLVTTAFVVDEGVEAADAGYYNSGRERILQRVDGGWVERPSAVTWTE